MGYFDGVGMPSWPGIINAAKASGLVPPLIVTSTVRAGDGYHGTGNAVDFSNGGNAGTPQMDSFAAWVANAYGSRSLEIIHVNMDGSTVEWKNGVKQAQGFYGAATLAQHHNHVHWAITNNGLNGGANAGPIGATNAAFSIPGSSVPGIGPIISAINSVGNLVDFIKDPKNWERIGYFILGAFLFIGGITSIPRVRQALGPIAEKAALVAAA